MYTCVVRLYIARKKSDGMNKGGMQHSLEKEEKSDMAHIVWAAGAGTCAAAPIIDLVRSHTGTENISIQLADLNGTRVPNAIVVIDSKFPYRSFLYDWEKTETPFVVISLEKQVQVPFQMCQQVIYV